MAVFHRDCWALFLEEDYWLFQEPHTLCLFSTKDSTFLNLFLSVSSFLVFKTRGGIFHHPPRVSPLVCYADNSSWKSIMVQTVSVFCNIQIVDKDSVVTIEWKGAIKKTKNKWDTVITLDLGIIDDLQFLDIRLLFVCQLVTSQNPPSPFYTSSYPNILL